MARTLVLIGAQHFLDGVVERAEGELEHAKIVTTPQRYEGIAAIISEGDAPDTRYVAVVNDLFGRGLIELGRNAEKVFGPFEEVTGVFWLGGESSGGLGETTIKQHGQLDPFYRT